MKGFQRIFTCFISVAANLLIAGCASAPSALSRPTAPASQVRVYFRKPDNAVVIAELPYNQGMDYDQMRAAAAKAGGKAMLLMKRPIKSCSHPSTAACAQSEPQPELTLDVLRVSSFGPDVDTVDQDGTHDSRSHQGPPPLQPSQCLRGSVTLQFVILPSGHVRDVHVVDSDPPGTFVSASIKALKATLFTPKLVDHLPVATPASFTYRFLKPLWGECQRQLNALLAQ